MNGLFNSATPTGLAKTHAFEFNFQRRMSKGFNLNASYTRMFQKNKTILENEFNTSPTIWWDSDTARPHRLTATAIMEFPFGKGRKFLQTGLWNHVLGGWQSALTYEFQNGPLLAWGNNFYYGDVNNFEADATSTPKTLNQWFNTGLHHAYGITGVPQGHFYVDAETGEEISRGVVPDWCVAVYATRPRTYPGGEFGLPCVLVVKRLEEGERHDKAKLNDILREGGVAT